MRRLSITPVIACLTLSACGTEMLPWQSDDGSSDSSSSESAQTYYSPDGSIGFKGYVSGAFDIAVDGVFYSDSEDFFTKELDKLPSRASAAGYDSTWSVTFDAVLGFSDLQNGMTVYISPKDKKGYQGEGTVGSDGSFSIKLPQNANDTTYQVRAVKRINVILNRGAEIVKFCYNFSAIDRFVDFSGEEKPIILDKFETKFTRYACNVSSTSGIQLPTASAPASAAIASVTGVAYQDTTATVEQKWGRPDSMRVSYETIWDYKKYSTETTSSCSLIFRNGRLDRFVDCKIDYIDYLSF